MPSLSSLVTSQVTKVLVIGDSGTGKTGCLASLVNAGYKLFLIDMDNGWEALAAAVKHTCPDRLPSIQVESFRDQWKSSATGPVFDGKPTAFASAVRLLDRWVSSDGVDFGKPCDFGPECVVVLDSLTFLGNAAFNWFDYLNPTAGQKGGPDPRTIYGQAQDAVEHVLAMLTSPGFATNVVVTAHIRILELPDGSVRGVPTSVGKALGPTIPTYFNSMISTVSKPGGKRQINTFAAPLLDLKNPAPFVMEKELPIETGLATFFSTLRKPSWSATTQPKSPGKPSEPSKPTATAASPFPTGTMPIPRTKPGILKPATKPLATTTPTTLTISKADSSTA